MHKATMFVISAKQGGGKTTLANLLKTQFTEAKICKFADPLYRIHDAVWDVVGEYGVLPREKKSGDLLQMLGDFGRCRDQNVWVKCTQNWVRFQIAMGARYLINDDTRFENEFLAFDDMPELMVHKIRLECDRDIRKARCDAWRENENHISETALDRWAAEGKFDLYYDSGVKTPIEILEGVLNLQGDYDSPGFKSKHYQTPE